MSDQALEQAKKELAERLALVPTRAKYPSDQEMDKALLEFRDLKPSIRTLHSRVCQLTFKSLARGE
jgi:hypothetical protein